MKKDAGFRVAGKVALVLGAGGAARACVYGLVKEGASRVVVANRTRAKAKRLCRDLAAWARRRGTDLCVEGTGATNCVRTDVLEDIDLVVNATSLGLKPSDPLPLDPSLLPRNKKLLVMDLIYKPSQTKLLRKAAKRGFRTLDGLGMLLYQGARAFEIWTGKKAPIDAMQKALKEAISA